MTSPSRRTGARRSASTRSTCSTRTTSCSASATSDWLRPTSSTRRSARASTGWASGSTGDRPLLRSSQISGRRACLPAALLFLGLGLAGVLHHSTDRLLAAELAVEPRLPVGLDRLERPPETVVVQAALVGVGAVRHGAGLERAAR